jgi:error-prone DNA polymerase
MERLAYSINDTAKTLSLGRTSIYAMIAEGRLERTEAHVPILHLLVRKLEDHSDLLHGLHALDGDTWARTIAHADEVLRPNLSPDPRVKRKEALRQPSRDFH